ncbi:MAG TPA: zinc ribbon domain-containing protein [Acidobacteriota bacterium]|nr:zinc ribbon domain-containing protein [Acidobacteriota bacterium]HRR25387.1 zinc ribbon domain-containing protein [Acidobacteriota bacterium]HRV08441.1 zinc ribbon domain-containing protein [Acidobacteriota bacterium]
MPIYEFRCSACGRRFEEIVLRKDQKPRCPHCKSQEAERVLSGFAVRSRGRTAACAPGRPT